MDGYIGKVGGGKRGMMFEGWVFSEGWRVWLNPEVLHSVCPGKSFVVR